MIKATLEFDKDKIASCIAEDAINKIENCEELEHLTDEQFDTVRSFTESAIIEFFTDKVELD